MAAAAGQRSGALRSGAFRFALLLAAVFALGSMLLLWAVSRQIDAFGSNAADGMLRSEAAILAGEYRQLGRSGLVDAIQRHATVNPEAPFHYLLIDAQGRRLIGTLPLAMAREGWGSFEEKEPDGQSVATKRLGIRLPDGLLLVVATDMFDVTLMRGQLQRFTLLSGLGITLFALVGGFLAGRLFLSRLHRVNQTVERMIDGNLAERLPAIGVAPEFDTLTDNLNRMLDRNAAAMEGLREVSSAVAHDLRTPLMRLQQKLESMRASDAADPREIDGAIDQIEKILDTFQALLRIGMIEGGVGRSRFVPLDLAELLDRLCDFYGPVAEDADHRLDYAHDAGAIVEGDADMLAQLFTNLLENAILHTPPGTRISSTLRLEDDYVVAVIADDGPGVPERSREKIFQKFHREDRYGDVPGAGLGLSLVAAIADIHGAGCRVVPSARGFAIELVYRRVPKAP